MAGVQTGIFSSTPIVDGNALLRVPQRDGYEHIRDHFQAGVGAREIGIVLPVGCGKSGLITMVPFAAGASRVLVVAPFVRLAGQLYDDFDFARPERCFYTKFGVLSGPDYPEPVPIRGTKTNISDLRSADVVITNIGQLQGDENDWLAKLPEDFFDLIVFDEGHHSVADTYEALKRAFPAARIINFSATPTRTDGRRMPGVVIYSYAVRDAIAEGYVKHLTAHILNPASLRYVRREDGAEVEVGLEEVIRLGAEDAGFRRSIVTSAETRDTIVDASLAELDRLRQETGEGRLKIIASALNHAHCIDIVEAYRARGRRADFVHSLEGEANDRVHTALENHELDAIVQVRMLGEGFDHRYLSVAAVFSVFRSLSPFVQFVGRIMRSIVPSDPGSPLNRGTVIYHAGSNVAPRWTDFREFSGADQDFFAQLLPEVAWTFGNQPEIQVEPAVPRRGRPPIDIREQLEVTVEEIPLIERDDRARAAIEYLGDRDYSEEAVVHALRRIRGPKWAKRDAARRALDDRVRNAAGEMLNRRGVKQRGRDLDPASGRDNWVVVKTAIDRRIAGLVGRRAGERAEYDEAELSKIETSLEEIVAAVEKELLNG